MKTEQPDVRPMICLSSWDTGLKDWLCPVCGKKRNIGNHKKCSKITQLKHQQEREAKAGKR